ncbi:MAG: HepT-like ribonuclease domain-containing protein [Microcoleaceae cyanobacterium]
MSSRSAKARIQDILNAIDSIQMRTAGMSFDQFSQDETIVKAVLYDLIIIGEAAINIPADVQTLAPELPWRLMSDSCLHQYHH